MSVRAVNEPTPGANGRRKRSPTRSQSLGLASAADRARRATPTHRHDLGLQPRLHRNQPALPHHRRRCRTWSSNCRRTRRAHRSRPRRRTARLHETKVDQQGRPQPQSDGPRTASTGATKTQADSTASTGTTKPSTKTATNTSNGFLTTTLTTAVPHSPSAKPGRQALAFNMEGTLIWVDATAEGVSPSGSPDSRPCRRRGVASSHCRSAPRTRSVARHPRRASRTLASRKLRR